MRKNRRRSIVLCTEKFKSRWLRAEFRDAMFLARASRQREKLIRIDTYNNIKTKELQKPKN